MQKKLTVLAMITAVVFLLVQRGASARLLEISIPSEGSVTYGQYQGGMPQQIVLPGGVVKSMAYDPLSGMVSNRVVDVSGNPVMDRRYQRNRTGTITGMNTEHGNYNYSYDTIDQLTHVADPVLPDQAFSYDGAGNRVTSGRYPKPGTGDPEVRTYAVNNLNQYLSVTSESTVVQLSYDLNGNVLVRRSLGEGGTQTTETFTWDGENRLVGYSNSETGVSASYYYDPFGRRLRKVVNGVTNWYVYADEGLVEEMDAQGKEVRSYGYAPDSAWMNDPLYMRVPGIGTTNIYYFLNDHLGAPQKLVAKNGEVVWSMESEAFGKATASPDSTVTNNLRLSSQYFDEELGLHYNTQRYYDPESGRYVSRDPIGEEGGANKYLSVKNDPVDHIDPLGLLVGSITVTRWGQVKTRGLIVSTRGWQFFVRWNPPVDGGWANAGCCKPCRKAVWLQRAAWYLGWMGLPLYRAWHEEWTEAEAGYYGTIWDCSKGSTFASMADIPQFRTAILSSIDAWSFTAESYLKCVEGNDAGKVYGSVLWGAAWSYDAVVGFGPVTR